MFVPTFTGVSLWLVRKLFITQYRVIRNMVPFMSPLLLRIHIALWLQILNVLEFIIMTSLFCFLNMIKFINKVMFFMTSLYTSQNF